MRLLACVAEAEAEAEALALALLVKWKSLCAQTVTNLASEASATGRKTEASSGCQLDNSALTTVPTPTTETCAPKAATNTTAPSVSFVAFRINRTAVQGRAGQGRAGQCRGGGITAQRVQVTKRETRNTKRETRNANTKNGQL